MSNLFLKDWSSWAPGLETREDWFAWASKAKDIQINKNIPELKHLSSVSKRRLSQLSKMVLEVGHHLLTGVDSCHLIFCSRHGEINQQNKITKGLIDSGEVRPSQFSLSVFNTPVSLLSIHENITEPATVLFSGKDSLSIGLISLTSQLNALKDKDVLLIFSDEALPEDYKKLYGEVSYPYAYACLFSSCGCKKDRGIEISISNISDEKVREAVHPLEFLRWLITDNNRVFTSNDYSLKVSISNDFKTREENEN